ncbi:hypothetical protein Tco_0529279 [Tanacetum coccineum]
MGNWFRRTLNKKKMTLQQIRALETTNDEEVARKIQAEWDAEEERKRFEELKKTKPKTTLRKPTSLAQERNQMMSFLKDLKRMHKIEESLDRNLHDYRAQVIDSPDGVYLIHSQSKSSLHGLLILLWGRYCMF